MLELMGIIGSNKYVPPANTRSGDNMNTTTYSQYS